MTNPIALNHPFLRRCTDPDYLFGDPQLNPHLYRLEKQAAAFAGKDTDLLNAYKGDGFELFWEYTFHVLGMSKRVGMLNYQLVDSADDIGVDGVGIGIDGKPAAVQIKYRQANWTLSANADHLGNFGFASLRKYGVQFDTTTGLLIVTSAGDVHHHTRDTMFGGQARFIVRDQIRQLVDDHVMFWRRFQDSWRYSLTL